MPAATATLLDDSAVNIDEWLAGEVEQAFAAQEGTAFVSGDGTNKPKGFLHYTSRRSAPGPGARSATSRPASPARSPPSEPVRYADRSRLCAEGRLPAERRLRDEPQDAGRGAQAEGRRRQLSLAAAGAAGGRASLLGFPVVEAEDMPDIAANTFSIAFGDFRRGYLIVDRAGRARAARSVHAPSPMCCSTRPSASAAACRTSTRSSC